MYSIKLDENKFFTGAYAKVGKIEGGIDIYTLPPDITKAQFYKYDYHDVTMFRDIPDIDSETQLQKQDVDGNLLFIPEPYIQTIIEWIFDEIKYQEFLDLELADLKKEKIQELSKACNETITAGIDIQTSKGIEHFRLTPDDQLNLQDRYFEIIGGSTEALYHPDGDGNNCRMFTAEEIMSLALTAKAFKTYHTTYYNELKALTNRSTTKDEINSIVYGMSLPEDLNASLINLTGQSSIH